MSLVKIAARVRGFFAGDYPENDEEEQIIINTRGDLCIAQSLPELAELVRLGGSWQVSTTTGQAALTALPTTVAGLTIKNGEPANCRCYVIDSFGSIEEVVDATQTDATALMAMLNARNDAAPSGGTAETGIKSLSGRQPSQTSASILRGATVVNNGWFAHGTTGAQMAAAVAGANWKINDCQVRGLYIVPPGGSFSIQTVKAAAAAAAQQFFFVRWHEVQLKLVP